MLVKVKNELWNDLYGWLLSYFIRIVNIFTNKSLIRTIQRETVEDIFY